jgi:hypothetical protein
LKRKLPRRLAPILFGFILSGLNTAVVSAIVTYRNLGLNDEFVAHWLRAFVSAWPITFPTATLIAPWVRRFVEQLVKPEPQLQPQPITNNNH